MEIIHPVINTIEIILTAYLGFASVYIFVFALSGMFNRKQKANTAKTFRKFAVLIPGYKEDAVIIDVAKKALEQDYSTNKFDVIIIADSFQPETITNLNKLAVKVIEVSFEKSTKSKALNKAMEIMDNTYDIALVLDADNIMENDFLSKINVAFDNGYSVVQGHRVAKNLNTSFAILDAISEEINNRIFRKGHRFLGFSSGLIGSGMAFDYQFFKKTMKEIKAIGGFDKELEMKLLKNKIKIEYLNKALVFDEKIQKAEDFSKQRQRWQSTQVLFLKKNFFQAFIHLFTKGNIDYFDKVIQLAIPPRVIILGVNTLLTVLMVILTIINPEINNSFSVKLWHWLVIFGLTFFAFLFAVPINFYNSGTLKAIISLPHAFWLMILNLLKIKGADRKFIHTTHGSINKKDDV